MSKKPSSCFACRSGGECENGRIFVEEPFDYGYLKNPGSPLGRYEGCPCECHGEFCPICEKQHPKGMRCNLRGDFNE